MERTGSAALTSRAENRRVGVRVVQRYGLHATIANAAVYWICHNCATQPTARQQRTRRIQHIPSDRPTENTCPRDGKTRGDLVQRPVLVTRRDSEGGRRIDGVGDEMTVAIARGTSEGAFGGSPGDNQCLGCHGSSRNAPPYGTLGGLAMRRDGGEGLGDRGRSDRPRWYRE